MSNPAKRAIWWIKRDIRLHDNEALTAAIADGNHILPLFMFEPAVLCAPDASSFHLHAQWQALTALAAGLQQIGATLQFATGDVVDVLDRLYAGHRFCTIYSHQETGAYITYQRDLKVTAWCQQNKVHLRELYQNGVVRKLRDREQRQHIVQQRLFASTPLPTPLGIKGWQSDLLDSTIPPVDSIAVMRSRCQPHVAQLQPVTEAHAQNDCRQFLNARGLGYSGGISSPNTAFKAGSRLSAHLAWGTISLRSVFHQSNQRLTELRNQTDPEAARWRKSIRAFQSRLYWHDHFIQRLESAPGMEFEAINPAYRAIKYHDRPHILEAWSHGQTGIPLLDACMRCLMATGFLNFRMRAMLVTTACFGLGLHWKSIHNPLAQVFLDYEPGIHLSQIQMQAGIVGINTVRIYSPHKQLLDQDPDCVFTKQWVPELRNFDAKTISAYESTTLGDYPAPVIDIKGMGKFMKDQIYAIRKSEQGREASAVVLKDHGSRRPARKQKSTGKKGTTKKNKPASNQQLSLDL